MEYVNEWDFASEFTATEAAILIEGMTPSRCTADGYEHLYQQSPSSVILSRMKEDYETTHTNYIFQNDVDDPFMTRELLPWESKLPSSSMKIMAKNCFEFGLQAEFQKWLSDGNASHFHGQKFARKDIQYWLDSNKLPTRYEFEKKAAFISDEIPAKEECASSRWPWGNHHTELLGHLEAAAQRYWVGYDSSDASTAPINTRVSEWLQKDRKVSKTMADSIASILRLDGLPTGPRK